mmetsp:Transcript_9440/g.24049  ORF Transcript_9440/g.24049 Transcript_9440/m.24049 type:complete len:1119 (+) Transcript_9440:563-3919(+)
MRTTARSAAVVKAVAAAAAAAAMTAAVVMAAAAAAVAQHQELPPTADATAPAGAAEAGPAAAQAAGAVVPTVPSSANGLAEGVPQQPPKKRGRPPGIQLAGKSGPDAPEVSDGQAAVTSPAAAATAAPPLPEAGAPAEKSHHSRLAGQQQRPGGLGGSLLSYTRGMRAGSARVGGGVAATGEGVETGKAATGAASTAASDKGRSDGRLAAPSSSASHENDKGSRQEAAAADATAHVQPLASPAEPAPSATQQQQEQQQQQAQGSPTAAQEELPAPAGVAEPAAPTRDPADSSQGAAAGGDTAPADPSAPAPAAPEPPTSPPRASALQAHPPPALAAAAAHPAQPESQQPEAPAAPAAPTSPAAAAAPPAAAAPDADAAAEASSVPDTLPSPLSQPQQQQQQQEPGTVQLQISQPLVTAGQDTEALESGELAGSPMTVDLPDTVPEGGPAEQQEQQQQLQLPLQQEQAENDGEQGAATAAASATPEAMPATPGDSHADVIAALRSRAAFGSVQGTPPVLEQEPLPVEEQALLPVAEQMVAPLGKEQQQQQQEEEGGAAEQPTKSKTPRGFPGLLNKVGKGISKGFTTTTRTIVAIPTSVANVFQDSDVKEEVILPAASFTQVDPEPFELYDSQYPDLKSLMSLPMSKDPRRGKGNREDDGIKPVRPKPLVPSNAGSCVLDSQLPSGATSPLQAQSSLQDAEQDSLRSSLDSRRGQRQGAGVSVSVSLSGGTPTAKDASSLRRSAGEVEAHATDKRAGRVRKSSSGLRASMPTFPFSSNISSMGRRTSEDGERTSRAKGVSTDGHRGETECNSPPGSRQNVAGSDPHTSKDKERESASGGSGLGLLFSLSSRRREANSSSQQQGGGSCSRDRGEVAEGGAVGQDRRDDDKDSDKPLTKRLAMKLGLGVSTSPASDNGGAPSPTSPGSDALSHASRRSTAEPASTSVKDGGVLLATRSRSPPRYEDVIGDRVSPADHPHYYHPQPSMRGRRQSGDAAPSLPSRQQQLHAEEEEEAEEMRSRGSCAGVPGRDNADVAIRRTASDVKRKYGRRGSSDEATGATKKSETVGGVASQTRSKLAERGEKLSAIKKLTLEMQGGAAGFAEMARQVAEQEKGKKWYQL